MRIGVLTGGGDAPGLNAAIRAVARRAFQLGHQVSGVQNGWAGCLEEGMIDELTPASVRGILPMGGTILGTSRTNPLKEKDGIARVVRALGHNGIDALVAIGGDDTLSVAAALHEAGFPTVGVPKTIDNDLAVTEFCIGFDTAVGVVTEALDRLHTTASAHHRVMVVEVMGRDAGWVALMGGVAGGADLILIPEFEESLKDVVGHLYRRRGDGKLFSIIVVAEGARIPELESEAAGQGEKDAFGHVRLSKRDQVIISGNRSLLVVEKFVLDEDYRPVVADRGLHEPFHILRRRRQNNFQTGDVSEPGVKATRVVRTSPARAPHGGSHHQRHFELSV